MKQCTCKRCETNPVHAQVIYLSGPMTGKPDFNAPEFTKYAEKYRALGWKVFSPPELDAGDTNRPYSFYIRRDVRVFLDEGITAIYMLPDWKLSRGARLEKHLADLFDVPAFDATTDAPLPVDEWRP